jgi:hypothetical protein
VVDEDLHVTIFRTAQSSRWYCQLNQPGRGQIKVSLKTTSQKEARSRARRIARDLEAGMLTLQSNRAITIAQAAADQLIYLATK